KENSIYVDSTVSRAVHSLEINNKLNNGKLIGIDQDQNALAKAKVVLSPYKEKTILIHDNYANIEKILKRLDIEKVDGILLDLGVSSHQLDEKIRGFSYHNEAKLDMRMDETREFTAWDVVNKYSERELEDIIWSYSEDRWARRIAKFIVVERKTNPINTTLDLVNVIKKAIPKGARMKGGHPARQTFQAIRIEVNRELEILKNTIETMIDLLNPSGRLAIITFHSLEDRIVKNAFKYAYKDCICPPDLPICNCDKKREVEIITRKPIIASKEELDQNPRSKSAKLRVVEKI